MVVVYLRNGGKAPLPDANYVKIEPVGEMLMLRCLYGGQEVGQFKWDEVAGYSMAATSARSDLSPASSYDAWSDRLSL